MVSRLTRETQIIKELSRDREKMIIQWRKEYLDLTALACWHAYNAADLYQAERASWDDVIRPLCKQILPLLVAADMLTKKQAYIILHVIDHYEAHSWEQKRKQRVMGFLLTFLYELKNFTSFPTTPYDHSGQYSYMIEYGTGY